MYSLSPKDRAKCEACKESHLCDLWLGISAKKVQEKYALWRSVVLEEVFKKLCKEEMEEPQQDKNVRLVREGICTYEGTPEGLREILREQISLDEKKRNRIDRLRGTGNGVVPAVAGKAFVCLMARFMVGMREAEK